MSTAAGGPKFPLRLDRMVTPAKTLVKQPEVGKAPPAARPTPIAAAIAAPAVLRPQRPLQHAADISARHMPPTGLGLDSAGVRQRMADRLRVAGLGHPAVLAALAEVPRHLFVDAALVTQAYEDTSLPIGHGQTISKPSVVGRMIELLMHGANARAAGSLGRSLEIGTGCGYQAAVLARLSRQVMSVERVKALHDKARELLLPLRLPNVRLIYGDGMIGHPPNAPYDSIISAAGGEVSYEGRVLLDMDPDERAREGVFMAFQYPVEIAGVNNAYFLKAALNAKRKHHGLPELGAVEFM